MLFSTSRECGAPTAAVECAASTAGEFSFPPACECDTWTAGNVDLKLLVNAELVVSVKI